MFGYRLFAENWELIVENAVAKYFLKGKTLFTCYCSRIFCILAGPWTVLWDMNGAVIGLGGALPPLIYFIKNITILIGTNFSNFVQ